MKIFVLVFDYEEAPHDHYNIAAFDDKHQAETLCENLNKQFVNMVPRYKVEELEYVVDANKLANTTLHWNGTVSETPTDYETL